ncbi:MAG: PAQR family membrane homeostasis protein TrhA [Thermoplasmatota archaeon]
MGLREPFNSISHMVGGGLGIAGLVTLILLADGPLEVVAAALYGFGLVATYTFSAVYHGVKTHRDSAARRWLQRLDHVAIYLLIAGTYTPVVLVKLGGGWGWSLFGTVWGVALVGITLKLTLPMGRNWPYVVSYIGLGWIAVVAAPVLFPLLTGAELAWLLTGGITYTLGVIFYAWDKPRIVGPLGAHELWHLFVLAGSVAHFVFVAAYVL